MTPEQKLEMLKGYLEESIKTYKSAAKTIAEIGKYVEAQQLMNEASAFESILHMLEYEDHLVNMYNIYHKGE